MPENTIDLVRGVVSALRSEGVDAWLGGGWGEELRGIAAPRPHGDIDLYVRSGSIESVDDVIERRPEWLKIEGKKFPHKRAFELSGVMVELTVVDPTSMQTTFFDDRVIVTWPSDMFDAADQALPVVSEAALHTSRQMHQKVADAYRDYGMARR